MIHQMECYSATELTEIKGILEIQRDELAATLVPSHEATLTPREASAYGVHCEAACEEYERLREGIIDSHLSAQFNRILAALQRIDHEPKKFGVCDGCGGLIPLERLKAVPVTHFCIECKLKSHDGNGNGRK